MIALIPLKRWRKPNPKRRRPAYVETVPAGTRVDWVDENHVYWHLGFVAKEDGTKYERPAVIDIRQATMRIMRESRSPDSDS